MVETIMSLALAFGISFYAFPVIIEVSNDRKLFDHPDDFRKIHRTPVPSMGGLGIYAGIIISLLLMVGSGDSWRQALYIMLASIILFFIGAKDDLMSLTPIKKFLGQVLAAAILIFKGGFLITNMDGIFGVHALPDTAAYPLSFLTIIVIINAYNLIDGVDGLAAGLSLLSGLFFMGFFWVNGQELFACLAAAMVGSLLAFLIFNIAPARLFMGDTGSLIIGLFHAVLVIQFINSAGGATTWPVQSAPAVGFMLLFVPLFDTLRVFSARILHGVSPFTPDRNHIHHILMRAGFGHRGISIGLMGFSLVFMAAGLLLQALGSNALFLLSLVTGAIALGGLLLYHQSRLLRKQKNEQHEPAAKEAGGSIRSLSFEQRRKAN